MSGFLLAGLGNIGEEYKHSRHNIGFDVIDLFVARHQGSFASDRLADRAVLRIRGRKVTCIK